MSKDIKYIAEVSPQDMNALTNLNYQDLHCEIDFKNLLVKKPWGSEYLLFENEFCAIWILDINYMENTSMHCHPKKETSLVCLNGDVSCNTLNNSNKINSLDGIFLGKKVFHQTQSISLEGSSILEIETPVNKFDLVRINDTYGRQGKEYENRTNYKQVKDLTLDSTNNSSKIFNDTNVTILTIESFDELKKYHEDSIIAILSASGENGKIFRLKDMNKKLFISKTTIIIISENIDD